MVKFFEAAGYSVDSVGFTFILTEDKKHEFQLGSVEGDAFLSDYGLFNSPGEKWVLSKFSDYVSKCTMTTASS